MISDTSIKSGLVVRCSDVEGGQCLRETLGELKVDADTAVLAGVGDSGAGADSDKVLVEGDVEDGAGGIKGDIGVASRAARSDGVHTEDLDGAGLGSGGDIDDAADLAGGESGSSADEGDDGGETHFDGWWWW